MPANLTPQYLEAEQRYKKAKNAADKLFCLEEMMAIIPKHKGTEKLRSQIKKKLASLKKEGGKDSASKGKGINYNVKRLGAAQVMLVGSPNTGKSSLLKTVTNTDPAIGDYPFTTRFPQPGMLNYENIQIQLVDLPPLDYEYMENWLPGVIRDGDAAILFTDLASDDPFEQLDTAFKILEQARISISSNPTCRKPGEAPNLSGMILATRADLDLDGEMLELIKEEYGQKMPLCAVSLLPESETGIKDFQDTLFNCLNIIRIYTKMPGKETDKNDPVILPKGAQVIDFALNIHKDFARKLKFARIWTPGKYDGQMVNRNHNLIDGDIIELKI